MKSIYTFYIDESEEVSTLNEMLQGCEGCSAQERAKEYGIPLKIAQKCGMKTAPAELADFVHQTYLKKKSALSQALQYHQTYWADEGQRHLEKVAKIMGQKLPAFRVRLDLFCSGTSDWAGTNISVQAFAYKTNPSAWYASILWETILAITFQKIRQKYSKKQLSDAVVWAVSEMTSCAMINCEFPITWNIGYTQLFPHQKHILQLYRYTADFSDFLNQLIDYFASLKSKITL